MWASAKLPVSRGDWSLNSEWVLLHIVKDIMVVFSEAFFIHPSIHSSRHPSMDGREENPDRNK
jgi:hypothetical protein